MSETWLRFTVHFSADSSDSTSSDNFRVSGVGSFYVLHESAKTASLCIPQVGEGGDERIFFGRGGEGS